MAVLGTHVATWIAMAVVSVLITGVLEIPFVAIAILVGAATIGAVGGGLYWSLRGRALLTARREKEREA